MSTLSGNNHMLALRPRTTADPALRRRFGSGLGIYRRGGDEADLCESSEPNTAMGVALPFPCHHRDEALPQTEHATLLDWLEQREPWRDADGGFYRTLVFGLERDADVPDALKAHFSPDNPAWAEQLASTLFQTPLTLRGPIALHQMARGHGVGIHSDEPAPGEETHRIVITCCRPCAPDAGGHFILLSGDQPRDARVVVPLRSNALLAFGLERRSHHAITSIRSSVRYSVVMSFRRAAAIPPEGAR